MLDHLPYAASIVTICVGANDLVANPYAPRLTRRLERLAEAAPQGSILCTLPAPSFSPTASYVNRAVRRAAAEHGHLVAELGAHLLPPHRGLSADRYHPNDRGYDAWVRAFATPMGIDPTWFPARHAHFGDVRPRRASNESVWVNAARARVASSALPNSAASQPMNSERRPPRT